MPPASPEIVAWVARHVLPHEADVRAWLRRARVSAADADELVQEAYCRLTALPAVAHIDRPDAYLFRVVRNLHFERLRRERVVPMTGLTESDLSSILDDAAGPDRTAMARRRLARVQAAIDALPDRCRQVFVLRRVEGLSQRAIAERLGVTESMVENDVGKGLRLLMRALDGTDGTSVQGDEGDRAGRGRRKSA